MNNEQNISYEQARDSNRDFWDEISPVHLRSYGVDQFLAGGRWLPLAIVFSLKAHKGY